MKKTTAILICCSILIYGFSNKDYSNLELAKAVHQVESSGRTDKNIIGDNGKAIGPLQIHLSNWKDATDFDKTISIVRLIQAMGLKDYQRFNELNKNV